jgi:hypothetical protein
LSNLCLGKLDAVRSPFLGDLVEYTTGKLPQPPPSVAAPNAVWGIDDNDRLGCCTISGVDHLIGAWDVDLDEHDPRPDDQQIEDTYFQLTGGGDTGLNEQFVLQTWQSTGLFGNKIAAFAPFNGQKITEMHQAIAFYRGAYLGIQCPQSCQQQFANGEPWTYVAGSPILGGHCICAVGYTQTSVLCVSWGALVEVTYPFFSHYLDESWAIIGQEIQEHHDDGVGVDLDALLADIAKI